MLLELKTIGRYLEENEILEKGFHEELKGNFNEGDKVTILEVNEDNSFNIKSRITIDEKEKEETNQFYYRGGNPSITGSGGIMGISPFFFDPSNAIPKKIKKSYRYADRYREKILDDTFVGDFLDWLLENADKISSLDTKWVFFSKFEGKTTKDLHRSFLDCYISTPRNKNIEEIEDRCDICGRVKTLVYTKLPFFALNISVYNHDLSSDELGGSRINICKDCDLQIIAAWKYLLSLFGNKRYLLIPRLKKNSATDSLTQFFRVVGNNLSSFENLNSVLNNIDLHEDLEFSFAVLSKSQQKTVIEKLVHNYKAYAIRFKDITLKEGDDLKYVNWKGRISINKIDSYFDLEQLLKFFFIANSEQNYSLHKSFHIYHLYTQKLPKKMDSCFKHLLYIHRENLFRFIYEMDVSALTRGVWNSICLNFLLYEIRKKREFWGNNADKKLPYRIMEGLNYYYFIKNKILGDSKMKTNLSNVESKFKELENDTMEKKATDELIQITRDNSVIVYYLIGQFIRVIDDMRYQKTKNKIFDDFIKNVNRRNIKTRFAEDVLQKQNYYIQCLGKKAKFVFNILADNLENIFEHGLYEEIIISLITGYYSNNLLKSSKKEGDSNDN